MANNMFIKEMNVACTHLLIFTPREAVASYLSKVAALAGFARVSVAHTYEDAEKAIHSRDPDVVLMSASTKKAEELLVARRVNKIWKNNRRRTPKILALPAPAEQDIAIAKRFGFYDIMPLPVTPGILRSRIEKVLENIE